MKAINWNKLEDPLDKDVWDRVNANFWLDTKVPVSNDIPTWNKMTPEEQKVIRLVFVTLTMLDTIQSRMGAPTLARHAQTMHEEAVYSQFHLMESIHAKSYSTIFSTLCSSEEIEELFRWAEEDDYLQAQANNIAKAYEDEEDLEGLFTASVILESMLFYTGFYAPLRFASMAKITNTADIIRLILRDEAVHGFYIGYKYQKLNIPKNPDRVYQSIKNFYEVELQRVEQIYDDIGWSEEVKAFLRYNANKALANLGLEPLFTPEESQVPAYILAALDPGTGESHDFFSGSGASYAVGRTEQTAEEDWNWDE